LLFKSTVMRKLVQLLLILVASSGFAYAQTTEKGYSDMKPKLGLKAGLNWSYLRGTSTGFNPDSKSGFMVGAFYSPVSKGMGFRTEIIFSRQGYTYDNGGSETEVMNDYIYLPQLTTFTIGRIVQLQLGAQIGFLLNSKKTTNSKDSSITDLMNKFDYGFAGGVEVFPFKGLLVGARYNLGLGKLYKHYEQSATNPNPFPLPFNPETTDFKNGVFQLYFGYRF
jgi:hypothetical protein